MLRRALCTEWRWRWSAPAWRFRSATPASARRAAAPTSAPATTPVRPAVPCLGCLPLYHQVPQASLCRAVLNLSETQWSSRALVICAQAHYSHVHTCVMCFLCCADPVAEHYLKSQTKYANCVSSIPHISPCDSAYDRDKEETPKQGGLGAAVKASGLERASSAHDEVEHLQSKQE